MLLSVACRRNGRLSEIVRPYKEQSIFWHRLWIDNGRPIRGLKQKNIKMGH